MTPRSTMSMTTPLAAIVVFALALAPAPAAAQHHDHKAPHGGTLIELGEEFAHLEVVVDAKTGTITAYVLDGEAERPVRIPQLVIALEVKLAKDDGPMQVALAPVASVLTGEQAGDASQFARQHDELKGLATFTGTVKSVTVRGRTFQALAFTYPDKPAS